jgi:hypothetical protein
VGLGLTLGPTRFNGHLCESAGALICSVKLKVEVSEGLEPIHLRPPKRGCCLPAASSRTLPPQLEPIRHEFHRHPSRLSSRRLSPPRTKQPERLPSISRGLGARRATTPPVRRPRRPHRAAMPSAPHSLFGRGRPSPGGRLGVRWLDTALVQQLSPWWLHQSAVEPAHSKAPFAFGQLSVIVCTSHDVRELQEGERVHGREGFPSAPETWVLSPRRFFPDFAAAT